MKEKMGKYFITKEKIVSELIQNSKKVGNIINEMTHYIPHKATRDVILQTLDFMKPLPLTLGLRISRWTKTQMEVIIPARGKNLDEWGQISEGVVCFAALRSFKKMWKKWSPKGNFNIWIQEISIERTKQSLGDLRLKMELSEVSRESVFAELLREKKAELETVIQVFDSDQESPQWVGQVRIKAHFYYNESLDWK